ncbi:hypothetical protein BJF85_23060 [Saccharomonospora sp. CUA-673]|uniref:hypothetical protein n=1 Tax=Saccharomonospora sp. CUA-673 TaxID=1904969 RepID=UPI00095EC4AB|nr:hypothetical protein [Saccharomonospora sp. CUA-673]OLT42416.1 hypothetical protein BJF85_23060 [Saccharomonospora sp. CUA-673]
MSFQVEIEALENYGNNLQSFCEQATEFEDLTGRAAVPDDAWGLVGLMTKGKYDEALAELKNLLETMKEGLDTTSDKMELAARIYRGCEDDNLFTLGQHEVNVQTTTETRV